MGKINDKLRVLIADPCEETMELLVALFAYKGYAVESASDRAEAVATAARFGPDAIFTSIVDVDPCGRNLGLTLRSLPQTAGSMIVAVTNYGNLKDDPATTAGFDHFFIRPVALELILGTMAHLTGYNGKTVPLIKIPLHKFYSLPVRACDG